MPPLPPATDDAFDRAQRTNFVLGAPPITDHLDSLRTTLTTRFAPTEPARQALTALAARLSLLEDLCADAYQFCGANDAPTVLLDNLSMASAGRAIPHPPGLGLFPDRLHAIKTELAEQTRHLQTIRPLLTLLHRLHSTLNRPDGHLMTTALTTLASHS